MFVRWLLLGALCPVVAPASAITRRLFSSAATEPTARPLDYHPLIVHRGGCHRRALAPREQDEEDHVCSADIVIVGGGIAGLALLLGIIHHLPSTTRVILVERRPEFVRAGATLGFAANGAMALKELTKSKAFVQKIQAEGMDMMPVANVPVHVLPWWVLHEQLLARVEQHVAKQQHRRKKGKNDSEEDGIQIWKGLKLNSLVQQSVSSEHSDQLGAVLGFSNSPRRISAKLVVAADGVHSTVRSLLGLPAAEHTGMNILRGFVQVSKDSIVQSDGTKQNEKQRKQYEAMTTLLGKGHAPLVLRDGDDLSYFAVFNHHAKKPGLLMWQLGTPLSSVEKGIAKFRKMLRRDKEQLFLLNALLENNLGRLSTTLSTINMDHISVDTGQQQGWGGQGRVTLIGDAAHACRPTDGQGANMALEDACVLVRHLARASSLTPAERVSNLILQFENDRRPRVKRIHRDQAERAVRQGSLWSRWSPEFMKWVYDGV